MRRPSVYVIGLLAIFVPKSLGQDAPVTTENPEGAQYIAVFPNSNPGSGSVVASSSTNGTGVGVQVSLSGLPSHGGPSEYTVDVNPVSSNGSCSSTGGVLNPYNAKSSCSSNGSSKCQVGDLSGKQGTMPGPNFAANYIDLYLSTIVGSSTFVGNRSLVISTSNGTILTCANFTMNAVSAASSSGSGAAPPLVMTAGSALPMGPGPVVISTDKGSSVMAATPAAQSVAPPQSDSPASQAHSAPPTSAAAAPQDGGNLAGPPASPGGNLRPSPSTSLAPKDKDSVLPAAAPAPPASSASQPSMKDGCNSTSPAASVASPPALMSTPGVVPGFTPSLNDAAITVTTTVRNMSVLSGPGTTVTQLSNNTVTVVVQVPQNSTGSSPAPSPVCGTGIVTTLPNGSTATVIVGPNGYSSAPNGSSYVLTTISGGQSGTTTTLPGSSMTILGMTMARPGWRSIVTVPPSQATVLTITETGPQSSSSVSMTTITVPPSSASIVTVPASTVASTSGPSVLTIVAGPVGMTTTLSGVASVVQIPAGATSVVSVVQNLAQPTLSVLELLGGPAGMTTMLPEITSLVKVPAQATSLVTLPAVDPALDVMTLLGGATGLTTELPALETPDLGFGSLDIPGTDQPPALTTDVIEPPDITPDLGSPLDDQGDAARPSMAMAACAAGAGALGLIAFVL